MLWDPWTVLFVPCIVLTCDVIVHVQEKKKKKQMAENANVGLETRIQTHTKIALFLQVFFLDFTFLYGVAKEIIWLIFGFYGYQAS